MHKYRPQIGSAHGFLRLNVLLFPQGQHLIPHHSRHTRYAVDAHGDDHVKGTGTKYADHQQA